MTAHPAGDERRVLVVTHPGRADAAAVATDFCAQVAKAGMRVRLLEGESEALGSWSDAPEVVAGPDAAEGCELIVVFGGDGTILRGAEFARPTATPLLGVNLGHVGFLAEAEVDNMEFTVDRVVNRTYDVEERLTIDVEVFVDGESVATHWALNEASVEKSARERMLELVIEVDARPLSRFGCTGSCAPPRPDRPRTTFRPVARSCGHRCRLS